MTNPSKSGFTLRAAAIAVVLSLFLLASTSYIALKLGAAPWPIIFAVIVSGGLLKLFSGIKSTDIHEINVAQAGASVGGLVAAGVAFTVPGILFLNRQKGLSVEMPEPWVLALLTVVAGVLGVLLSVPLKQRFVDEEDLPYPAGTAGAELLKLGNTGGAQLALISAIGAAAGIFALSREVYFPGGWTIAGLVSLGIILKLVPLPIALSSGYILGPRASLSWLGGAIIGWVILIPALIGDGAEFQAAKTVIQNLGMGIVLGSGIGFFTGYILPRLKAIFQPMFSGSSGIMKLLPLASILAIIALLIVEVPLMAVLLTVAGTWMMVTIAARMTGETNINPLEQFGIFMGLVILFLYQVSGTTIGLYATFMIIIFVSVACAVAGDIGHDFKSASLIGTRFMDIVKVDLIAVVAAGLASPFVIDAIHRAFANELFTDIMPAPQAQLVAGSISGFEYPRVFLLGLGLAFAAEIVNLLLPEKFRDKIMIMPLGIGLFLGLGLAIPIAAGSLIRAWINSRRPDWFQTGLLVAAGVMGGEGIAGFTAGALTIAGFSYGSAALGLGLLLTLVMILAGALAIRPGYTEKHDK